MRALAALAAPALLAITGCAGSYPRLSFAVEQRLMRETTLDDLPDGKHGENDSIVRIMRTGRQAGLCTGALIGPRHVLTAQHCMMKVGVDKELTNVAIKPGDVHVELGGDYLPWGRVGVREIHACPGFVHGDDGDVAHDVAVLVLSKPVPESVARFAIDYETPSYDHEYALSGFGSEKAVRSIALTADPSVVVHDATDWPISVFDRHAHEGPLYLVSDGRVYITAPGVPGDSGGPIVDTKTKSIVSVISRGRSDGEKTDDDPGGPLVVGPRLSVCRTTINEALDR